MRKNILKAGTLFLAVLIASDVFAATDGTVGATSTGTATISVTLPKLVRVRGLRDFAFGSYTGTGDLTDNENINVSSNYTAGTYRVRARGSGAAFAFTLTDGTSLIPYTVAYNDATGTSGEVALTADTNLTTQGGIVKPLSTTTDNANYHVNILEANLQAVDAGSYSGTLSLIITPE